MPTTTDWMTDLETLTERPEVAVESDMTEATKAIGKVIEQFCESGEPYGVIRNVPEKAKPVLSVNAYIRREAQSGRQLPVKAETRNHTLILSRTDLADKAQEDGEQNGQEAQSA